MVPSNKNIAILQPIRWSSFLTTFSHFPPLPAACFPPFPKANPFALWNANYKSKFERNFQREGYNVNFAEAISEEKCIEINSGEWAPRSKEWYVSTSFQQSEQLSFTYQVYVWYIEPEQHQSNNDCPHDVSFVLEEG